MFLYSLFFTPYNYFKLIFWLLIFPEKLGKVKYYRASQVASLNDPDNHDGVVIHLKSDILEREVKWALGNITINKASGGGGISAELFQILKDDDVKVLHSVC